MRKKSTVTKCECTQLILNEFRDMHQVDAVYIDLAKAFDAVDHRILLNR